MRASLRVFCRRPWSDFLKIRYERTKMFLSKLQQFLVPGTGKGNARRHFRLVWRAMIAMGAAT
jgi:hypothetical protein